MLLLRGQHCEQVESWFAYEGIYLITNTWFQGGKKKESWLVVLHDMHKDEGIIKGWQKKKTTF